MTAAGIRSAAVRHGERAIADSRRRLGEAHWAALGEWVEDYVVELARQWAIDESKKPRT